MTKKLRTGVIGVGYLGKYHAQKYTELAQSQFIAICDTNIESARQIAAQLSISVFSNYQALIGLVDAVSIATPTPTHYEIARFFLEQGIHVLLEKPIATNLAEADDLIQIARKKNLVLQIGHIERFNNAIQAVQPLLEKPHFIESTRLAPFKLRGSDVSVVLDLMIHDIDIIQSIVKSPIRHIYANGASVISPFIDIANARLEFANGCVANITANRINKNMSRRLHIFQSNTHINLDLQHKKMTIQRKGIKEILPGIPEIIFQKQSRPKGDALKDQIAAFLTAIINQTPPVVSGEEGRYALQVATQINQIIQKNNDLSTPL